MINFFSCICDRTDLTVAGSETLQTRWRTPYSSLSSIIGASFGVSTFSISPAGSLYALYDADGASSQSVNGLDKNDTVIRWTSDSRSVTVSHGLLPARVEQFDLATGRRTLIRVIEPINPAGAVRVVWITVANDPDVYAYTVRQQLSQLFLIQGAR